MKCLVLLGTLAHPKELFIRKFGEGYNPEGISKVVRSSGSVATIGPVFWKDLDNYNLLSLVQEIKAPILFLHGSKDSKVPISEMELVFEQANEPKEKIRIEGADHDMRPHREKMYPLLLEWIRRKL